MELHHADPPASSHTLHSLGMPPPYTDGPGPLPAPVQHAQPIQPIKPIQPIQSVQPVQSVQSVLPPTSTQPLCLINSAYVLPGAKHVRPSNKVSHTLEPSLSSNPNELYDVIHRQLKLPPRPLLCIHGTHTVSTNDNKRDEYDIYTDFCFRLDLAETMLTGWEPGSKDTYWRETEILTDEDLKPAYRGGILRSRTYKPPKSGATYSLTGDSDANLSRDVADEEFNTSPEAKNLMMWCERFCLDPASVKSFTMHRKLAGFNSNAMCNVLYSHIRELNYRGCIDFDLSVAQRSVTIYSPHWINRLRTNRFVWWVVVLLQLWIITWPVIFFVEKRYEPVHTCWNASLIQESGSARDKRYAYGRNESSLAEYWAPAVKQAAWTRRNTVFTRMDADRLQGYSTLQLLGLRGEGRFVDNARGTVEARQAYRFAFGWGANS